MIMSLLYQFREALMNGFEFYGQICISQSDGSCLIKYAQIDPQKHYNVGFYANESAVSIPNGFEVMVYNVAANQMRDG